MKKQDLKEREKGNNKMTLNQLKEMSVGEIRQLLSDHERIVVVVSSEMLFLEVRELDV